MKKTLLVLSFAVMAIFSASFTACDCEDSASNDAKTEQVAEAQYQCPMKCEGDKTYSEPGECPKCGMDIKLVETTDGGHEEHSH